MTQLTKSLFRIKRVFKSDNHNINQETVPVVDVELEQYEISNFYSILEELGVQPLEVDQSKFEVYKGKYEGNTISITYDGKINFPRNKEMISLVRKAKSMLNGNLSQQYVVLAKPGKVKEEYHPNHLNAWLTLDQYYQAMLFFDQQKGTTAIGSSANYEEQAFERNGHTIHFHLSGKVISDHGLTFKPYLRKILLKNNPFSNYDLIIGQDEVGSGEQLGPLVIASVGLTPESIVNLQLGGVKDSKMVPQKISALLSASIRRESEVWNKWKMDPAEFNERENGDLVDTLEWGHKKAFYGLIDRLDEPEQYQKILLIVDKFDQLDDRLSQIRDDPSIDVDVLITPSGEEKSVSVAAASVMAKASRYRWLKMHEKIYGVKLRRRDIHSIRQLNEAYQLVRL